MCFLDPVFLAELSRYLQKKQRTYGVKSVRQFVLLTTRVLVGVSMMQMNHQCAIVCTRVVLI